MIIIDNDFSPSPFVIDQVLIGLLLSSMHEARATKKTFDCLFLKSTTTLYGQQFVF